MLQNTFPDEWANFCERVGHVDRNVTVDEISPSRARASQLQCSTAGLRDL